jgi:hypothetical protein
MRRKINSTTIIILLQSHQTAFMNLLKHIKHPEESGQVIRGNVTQSYFS